MLSNDSDPKVRESRNAAAALVRPSKRHRRDPHCLSRIHSNKHRQVNVNAGGGYSVLTHFTPT